MTLYDVIRQIPAPDMVRIEDALSDLMDHEGYGEVCIVVVRGEVKGWKLIESRKF